MAALTLLPVYPMVFGFAAVLAAGLVLMARLLRETPADDRGSFSWPAARAWARARWDRFVARPLAKTAAWTAVFVVIVTIGAAAGVAFAAWPQLVGGFLAGAGVATATWLRVLVLRSAAVEVHAERKDVAVDRALFLAFDNQQLEQHSGDHPVLPPYNVDDEVVLCSWCEDQATTRVNVVDGDLVHRELPSCARHVIAARLGEVRAVDALPDQEAYPGAGRVRL